MSLALRGGAVPDRALPCNARIGAMPCFALRCPLVLFYGNTQEQGQPDNRPVVGIFPQVFLDSSPDFGQVIGILLLHPGCFPENLQTIAAHQKSWGLKMLQQRRIVSVPNAIIQNFLQGRIVVNHLDKVSKMSRNPCMHVETLARTTRKGLANS
jgi:hypothetical protein